jgi:hypothetical protein
MSISLIGAFEMKAFVTADFSIMSSTTLEEDETLCMQGNYGLQILDTKALTGDSCWTSFTVAPGELLVAIGKSVTSELVSLAVIGMTADLNSSDDKHI